MDRPRTLNAGPSSAAHPRGRPTAADDIELLADDTPIPADDPPRETIDEPISFRRRQQQQQQQRGGDMFSQPSRLIPGLSGLGAASSSSSAGSPIGGGFRSPRDRGRGGGGGGPKDAGMLGSHDHWAVEGPGRRVGYEDLTAIDWIFEYTKERQRLRVLSSQASGLLGYVPQLLDASQAWAILVVTGMAVGTVAAAIDVTTDWLGDLKTGYCAAGPDGGAFYLNKGFCCFGYDEWSKCVGWRPWAAALGVGSAGGKWFIEYFFFLLFSVRMAV